MASIGRPARTNAEYFTHSANFRNDRRIKSIRAKLGPAGYGLVLMLMEALTDAENIQLSTDEIEMELLAGDFGVSVTEIHSLLQIGEKIGFFARNGDGFLICPDLNKALEPVFEKRNRARSAAEIARNKPNKQSAVVSVTETPITATETTQSKVEESIVKESKEKKTTTTSTSAHEAILISEENQSVDTVETEDDLPEKNMSGDSYFHFSDQLKKDRIFEESTYMSLKLTKGQLPGLIDQFTHEQRALAKKYPDYSEYKNHCFHWLRQQSIRTIPNGNSRQTPSLNFGSQSSTGPRSQFGQGADLSSIVYKQESFK